MSAEPESSTNNRSYTTSLGDTFRNVRASSLSAFGDLSPFRTRPAPPSSPHKRKSQLSVSRWFGGQSESSDEEDEHELGHMDAATTSGPSGDELPRFRVDGDEVMVDDPESDEDGLMPTTTRRDGEGGGDLLDQDE